MSIQAGPLPLGGQRHTLNCSASTEEYVVVVPVLNWVSVDGITGVTEGQQIDTSNTAARRSLTFNPVRFSHTGYYTCRARIVIPQAGINLNSNAQQNVSVQSKPENDGCSYCSNITEFSAIFMQFHLHWFQFLSH